jgi:hypothetical protein
MTDKDREFNEHWHKVNSVFLMTQQYLALARVARGAPVSNEIALGNKGILERASDPQTAARLMAASLFESMSNRINFDYEPPITFL